MGKSFWLEATGCAIIAVFVAILFVRCSPLESTPLRTSAYRLCTHLDFFQLAPDIKIGNGPDARKRKLPSCVEVDEAFWNSVKKADLFPVHGNRLDRESDMLGLIIFLSTNVRGIPRGVLLQVGTAPGGDHVLTIVRLPHSEQKGKP